MSRQCPNKSRTLMPLVYAGLLSMVTAAHAAPENATTVQTAMPQVPVEFNVFPAEAPAADDAVRVLRKASSALGSTPTTLEEVDKWSNSLTNALRNGGFPISQVVVTEQDWRAAQQGGALAFTAFPGRIHKVRLDNKSRVKDERLEKLVTKALCGSEALDGACLLQTSRLERATQLLQDVPGVAIAQAPQFSSGSGLGDVDVAPPC